MEKEKELNPANLPDTRETYEAPVIKIVGVRVERGFQVSDGTDSIDDNGGPGSW